MNVRSLRLASATALMLAVACGGPSGDAAEAGGEASTLTGVELAVATARAIQAKPAAADSILTAHGLTRAGFDSLMYDIATDSAQARIYAEAVR
jgi:hypothetical protein